MLDINKKSFATDSSLGWSDIHRLLPLVCRLRKASIVMMLEGLNLGDYIRKYALLGKKKPAIVYQTRSISYEQLNRLVNKIANHLQGALSVSKGDRVAYYLYNCPEILALVFACAKIGAIFVPINVQLPKECLAPCIAHSSPKVIFTTIELCSSLKAAMTGKVSALIEIDGPEFDGILSVTSEKEPENQVGWDDDCAILYSSGTTGLPKGALFSQRSVAVSALQRIESCAYTEREKLLLVLPLYFAGALVGISIPVMLAGGAIYLEQKFSPETALKMVSKEKITRFSAPATVFKRLSDFPEFGSADLQSIVQIETGGSPTPPHLIDIFAKKGVRIVCMYGLTETCGAHTIQVSELDGEPIYASLRENEILVVGKDDNPVPQGKTGEILLSGPTIMKCYWNNPVRTAGTMRKAWLRTGDLGFVTQEGSLCIVGRKDDMIISGGLNIISSEVENVLMRHPALSDATVLGLPHPDWVEAVTAFVVLKAEKAVSEEDLTAFCKQRLAPYKVPKAVIILDQIPYNPGQKALKKTLREQYKNFYCEYVT